jgi:malate/lactate dehydrogenase
MKGTLMKTIKNITTCPADKLLPLDYLPFQENKKLRVNIFAMGDVGSTLLSGLYLLGGDVIDTIGIWDIDPKQMDRFQGEYGQIQGPLDEDCFPEVEQISRENLFQADIVVFCASRGIPPVSETKKDVRMAQWEKNRPLVEEVAVEGAKVGFKGLLAVVSDPVDLLCKAAYLAAKGENPLWRADQIRGYGLGVMNSRGAYYAKKDSRFTQYLTEGRAFGPHGSGLVLANSLENYQEDISLELTVLTIEANLVAREKGYKPYIAPALSSGALSILKTIRQQWHYSSIYMGDVNKGAYFGQRNRLKQGGTEVEDVQLPEELFKRLAKSYEELCELV